MRQSIHVAVLLVSLALLAGCAGQPTGAESANALAAWLDEQPFSGWEMFRREDADEPLPASPDGLTLGSPNIFAAVGCNTDDLSSLDVLWTDRRTNRPLPKGLSVSVRLRGEEPVALGEFPEQTLRRVRGTAIAVSESARDDLRVTCVDFAPLSPEQNFLVRWFLVENTGERSRRPDLVLDMLAAGEWREQDGRCWLRGDSLAFVSDANLRAREDALEVPLGGLRPGDRASAAVLIIATAEAGDLDAAVERGRAAVAQLPELLEAAAESWRSWCARTPIETGDARTDDLLDSLLCLLLSHVGPDAIHTGSVKYAHNRAYVRDSYWAQRALLEIGRTEEAMRNLEFFHRAWKGAGIASYYEIPDGEGAGYGYHGVELPHYLVLMVRDAERLGGADGAQYWDMVRGCLDEAVVPPSGLQPMNGDETWLLAAPVRELDSLLANSWLLIASAEYGAELAARVGDAARAARYADVAAQARRALKRFVRADGEPDFYAAGLGADGSLDLSLAPGVLARGAVLDVVPASDQRIAAGLVESWSRLSFPRGIRTHARSASISGATLGYVLYAAAQCEACDFTDALAARAPELCSATGCAWEFHDLYDPTWGGEKRRLWDSAVLLMGMVRACCDTERGEDGLRFVPKEGSAGAPARLAAPFDADRLLADAGPALILHDGSANHADRLARELLRHRNRVFTTALYAGEAPQDAAIIVSRSSPGAGWRETRSGYWVREWGGPPQLWVRNRGHVWRDTDGVLADLLSLLDPQREQPLPFPDANYDLVSRFGQEPAGDAELSAVSLFRRASGRLPLTGGETTLRPGDAAVTAKTRFEPNTRLLKLAVSAATPRPDPVELTVTLPAGWWVVYARDMTGRWDRVRNPVGQLRLPDGRISLVYSFSAGEGPVHLTFNLARLPVGELQRLRQLP